jgi:hypothetical protein
MKQIKKIIRSIFVANLLLLALAGVPVIGNLYERKRDDLFDNEIKIEQVEVKEDEKELPWMNEVR